MSHANGAGDLLTRLSALAEEIPPRIAELEAERETIDQELRRLRKLHATLTDRPTAPARRSQTPPHGSQAQRKTPSARMTLAVAEAVAGINQDRFTGQDVHAAMTGERRPKHLNTVYDALAYLRELEYIAAAGTTKPENRGGHGRTLFRKLDVEVLNKLRAQVNA